MSLADSLERYAELVLNLETKHKEVTCDAFDIMRRAATELRYLKSEVDRLNYEATQRRGPNNLPNAWPDGLVREANGSFTPYWKGSSK